MSVINQMLKDLEQRSPESNTDATQSGNVAVAHSPIKIALVTGFCVLAVCFLSFYVWQLISENNALKAEKITNKVNAVQMSSAKNRPENISSQINTSKQISSNENTVQNDPINVHVTKIYDQQEIAPINGQIAEPTDVNKVLSNNSAETTAKLITAKPLVNNSASQVTPVKKAKVIADTHSHSGDSSGHSHDIVDIVKAKPKPKVNKMSVSRRQLSADELAEQKLVLAEKALAAKQIEKAEKLLEDVVIIRPSDSQTRKKLAALWFGRQAYQDAVNLLSQGIALNGKDSSLRQMKARIHLKQGQFTAALNTLKPLAQLKDEQYQVMLANTAQQAKQNKIAVDAYKMLIAMKPDIGRWPLGLAVLYDKNSQFELASMAYKKALTKNDLSVSSENFVKQRLQVIGQ
ncbi:tetratricopeptide repeat protein [Colwellia psychrerythraea]|uniref:Putative MSHA biogenesis protein MshN n=1 Tax=Colwellia psychrerythraea (strain 34H / ATCC BAA-681) TaxID=167879 RepID=Q47VF0_COLP3|nr:tetratricopeptide repeat protein [Colwellia psychrerythraea]AAZ25814.1 putative MSHA biogenesis protein MshN [Colwellia psychrerythraea 34H]